MSAELAVITLIVVIVAGWVTWRAVIAAAILIRMHPKMRTAGNFARAFFSWRRS
jgi:hypothetical protein